MSKHYAEFKVSDLFEYDNGSRLNTALRIKGKTPFLTAGFENRGLYGYVGNDITMFHKPITIDMFGNCFYHSYDCGGDDNVYFLEGDYSVRQKLYIASVLHKNLSPIYSYAKQFRKKQLDQLTITLPITDDTIDTDSPEPDWEYMEEYIKSIEERYLDSVEQYNRKNEDILDALHPDYHDEAPEAYDYAEFRVGELFEITPTKWYKNNPVVEEEISVPQVSNTTQPNGITSFEKYPANNDGNVITFSDTTVGGETLFYQPVDFIGYSHVQKMIPIDFEMNQKIAHYVISAFRKAVDGKFNYAAKFNRENASNTLITLPITPDGDPDWGFMEDYISFIEGGGEKQNRKLRAAKEEQILKQLMRR